RGLTVHKGLHHVYPALARPVGQRTAQRGGLHLLRRPLGVVPGYRTVYHATAGELRRADRSLTGPAGALLLVRLLTAATHLATVLRFVRTLPRRGQLGHHDLVHQRDVGLHVEHVVGQLHGADRAAVGREYLDAQLGRHVTSRPSPPSGPAPASPSG